MEYKIVSLYSHLTPVFETHAFPETKTTIIKMTEGVIKFNLRVHKQVAVKNLVNFISPLKARKKSYNMI